MGAPPPDTQTLSPALPSLAMTAITAPARPPASASYRGATVRVIAGLWAAAIVYTVAISALAARIPGIGLGAPIVEQIILLLLWGAATPAILWSAERLPLDRRRWLANGVAHGVIATAFIVALNLVAPAVTRLVLGEPFDAAAVWRYGIAQLVRVFHLALIVYAFILGAGHYLRTLDIRRAEQLRAERLRADLAAAQLRALTLQLQPHFLFNALNAVGALIITERNREAFDMVGRLGELLRALLAMERRDEVSLREELELAEAYVAIEQARLGDRLAVRWDVAADVRGALLPPMVLQPLLENAIRHGIARASCGGTLAIVARRDGGRLALEIRDDGVGPPDGTSGDAARGSGVGLGNTSRRLAHLYGADQRLELTRDGGWTRVRVELPFHVMASAPPASRDGEVAA
jgi:two-component sensor histidine kinase